MIYIGVTGWGDQDSLYASHIKPKDKLKEYATHFPIVEVDASFYAVQPLRNSEKWVKDTPADFQFVMKAYQGMTGHERGEIPFKSKEEMFHEFKQSLTPYLTTGKLAMVLFQFPPWFRCSKENVEYLRFCKSQMGNIPCALEFRHQSWFEQEYYTKTLAFMEKEQWIHSICDEPQAGSGSVPIIIKATHGTSTLVRFHGRNQHGWNASGQKNWRDVRYLYRYNHHELNAWKDFVTQLQQESEHVYLLFNNNSGGDAADNAKMMMDILRIEYHNLAPRQLDLF
ncbi:hypothetical protein Q73_12205 [Bacillus coahuilensis m2-6]|uniref:DUF72 domain-containing protein n=1 Tax=Bacillus coahuilensis TaxID=408580 RepID=UPI0007502282|nr:DUF72 domain-containing protein [Bacillus coahuilensis]KUP05786.1 hypothetical protein Q73_12205 [Bacillus coahuilensis m2-6]